MTEEPNCTVPVPAGLGHDLGRLLALRPVAQITRNLLQRGPVGRRLRLSVGHVEVIDLRFNRGQTGCSHEVAVLGDRPIRQVFKTLARALFYERSAHGSNSIPIDAWETACGKAWIL